ncbi:hypothetical protein H9L39_16963 [Fusarium oxysporum f. sp. albedinis]|nr:hypothetical protein H9L39_16963 [Fusarium oxysporum f. sp. albedinis]
MEGAGTKSAGTSVITLCVPVSTVDAIESSTYTNSGLRFSKRQACVNHKRKPHKQGKTPNHSDNCSPDSYDGQPPATPQHSSMTSSPHELDFTDQGTLDECLNWCPYSAGLPVQSQGHHMPQHEDNRHGIPTSVPGDYHGISKYGEQTHTQLVLQEEAVTQQTYGISGTGHPGVAMMTNTVSPQDQLSQQVQQLSINPLCLASGTATPVPSPRIPQDVYARGSSSQSENMANEPQKVLIQYWEYTHYQMAQSSIPIVSEP